MLKTLFKNYSFDFSDEQIEDYLTYENLLKEYNGKFNLTSITDSYEIYCKHFLDSVMGLRFFEEGKKILEIGSGGGFPSVPLKIANRNLDFTLIEATGKKCTFLNEVKKRLKFDNFNVYNARCEELAKKEDFREKFDLVTARAVAPIGSLMEFAIPFLKVGGIFVAYKTGTSEELLKTQKVGKILGATLLETIPYSLPLQQKRAFLIIKKTEKTNPKYPRLYSKIKAKPL